MVDTRHLIAYALIFVLIAALIAVVMRIRYLSPQAVNKRRRAQELDKRRER